MLTLLVFFQIRFQTPKPSTKFTAIYTANFLLHVDILGASSGFNIYKHVCTCCTLKKIEAENGFLLHVDIIGASLGFNMCKHVITCFTLKQE